MRFVLRKLKAGARPVVRAPASLASGLHQGFRPRTAPVVVATERLMEKLGVPPTLVAVLKLKALHAKVNVKFSVEGVERTVGGEHHRCSVG
jgi:hypothetical protein